MPLIIDSSVGSCVLIDLWISTDLDFIKFKDQYLDLLM